MRKQVQKERCTKIMLTKCKAVCCLYNKVQLAAAKMLDAEPAIFQFECNVPILCNDIPANDLNLPSETYTTDFVLHYDDGHTAVREAVFRSYLSRPSVAEKLELSRRYWQQQGISDWGIIIDKEDTRHVEKNKAMLSAASTFGCRTLLHRIYLQNCSPFLPRRTLFSFWMRTSLTASARGGIASST